jgi:hypothetical protein
MPLEKYSDYAVARSEESAAEWLGGGGNGYPKSWGQEAKDDLRRGYIMHDDPDFEAPTIMGYEALEASGKVKRMGIVIKQGCERVHFRSVGFIPKESA